MPSSANPTPHPFSRGSSSGVEHAPVSGLGSPSTPTAPTGHQPIASTSAWTASEVAAATSWAQSLSNDTYDNGLADPTTPFPGSSPYSPTPYAQPTPHAQPNPYLPLRGPVLPYGRPRLTPSITTAGFVLSIVSWATFGAILSIPGVILSVAGLVKVKKEPDVYDGKALAIVGIFIGALNIVATIALVVLLAWALSQ